MSERSRNSLSSGDSLGLGAHTTDRADDDSRARVRRILLAIALAPYTSAPDASGGTPPGGEGSQLIDAADGRGDPVIRAFGARVLGLTRTEEPSGEQPILLPAPDQPAVQGGEG